MGEFAGTTVPHKMAEKPIHETSSNQSGWDFPEHPRSFYGTLFALKIIEHEEFSSHV